MTLTLPEIEVPIEVAGYFEQRCKDLETIPSKLPLKEVLEGFPNSPSTKVSIFFRKWKQDVKPSGSGKAAEIKALKEDSECLQAIREMVAEFNASVDDDQLPDETELIQRIHDICTNGLESDDDGTEAD